LTVLEGPPAMKFIVKWAKETLEVETDATETVESLKAQIYSLTGVPVDKMKILGMPGGPLKDTDVLGERKGMKDPQKITLVGTAEEKQLQEPAEKTVFEEDLTEAQKRQLLNQKMADPLPLGLVNVGNTCYMASCVQALRAAKELKQALTTWDSDTSAGSEPDRAVTAGYKSLMHNLDTSGEPPQPFRLWAVLQARFPQFAQRGPQGAPMQQDAEECFRALLQSMHECLKTEEEASDRGPGGSLVDKLFGFKMKTQDKLLEGEEAIESKESIQRVLMCHLGTQTDPVGHLHNGVQLSLKEHVEKNSSTLGRNAQYERTMAMDSLPEYLVIQFARFGYKQASDSAGTEAGRVKVTRRVTFSKTLDCYDFVTEDLREQLKAYRDYEMEIKDEEFKKMQENAGVDDTKEKDGGEQKKQRTEEEKKDAQGDVPMPDAESSAAPAEKAKPPTGPMESGKYALVSIVAHKGRSASGGHYVALAKWRDGEGKKKDEEEEWLMFDDEHVVEYKYQELEHLGIAGGRPDTQIAYLLMYKKIPPAVSK